MLITRPTWLGRSFLRPEPCLDAQILGIVGRAHELSPVDLHAFLFLPARVQLLMTVPSRPRLSAFLGYVFKCISDVLRAERRWGLQVWRGRPNITVLDPVEALAALRTIHGAPVNDNVVAHPTDWPGVSSAAALIDDEQMLAVWTPARERRRSRGEDRVLEDSRVYRFPLAPLPLLEGSTRQERVELIKQIFDTIAREAAARRHPFPPLGRRWALELDPLLPDPRDPTYEKILAYDKRWGLRPNPASQAGA